MTNSLSTDFSRRIFGGSDFCPTAKFGMAGTVLSKFSPNEFSAHQIPSLNPCPLPRVPCPSLSKASGMNGFITHLRELDEKKSPAKM
jgi:hypothetical protein